MTDNRQQQLEQALRDLDPSHPALTTPDAAATQTDAASARRSAAGKAEAQRRFGTKEA